MVLEEAEASRASLVARIVISPSQMVSDLNALSDHLSFPIKLGNELQSYVGAWGHPDSTRRLLELANQLDPRTPSVVVWLLAPKSRMMGFCAALTFIDATRIQTYLNEFGREHSFHEGISERIDAQGSRLFLAALGRTLLVANSPGALRNGGALAMENLGNTPQIESTIWPQAFMKGSGLTAKTIAAFLIHQLESESVSRGEKMTPVHQRIMTMVVEALADFISETQTIAFSTHIDNQQGIVLQGKLLPVPETALAKSVAHPSPISFEPMLPVSDDKTWFGAFGEGGVWMDILAKFIAVTGPEGARFAKVWREFYGERVGNGACVLDLSNKPFSECRFTMKSGVSPSAALDAITDYVTALNVWVAEFDGQKSIPWKVRRSKNQVSFEKKIAHHDPRRTKLIKAFFAGEFYRMKATVKDGKIILVQGGQALSSLAPVTRDSSATPPPIFTHTLARSQGADFMFSIEPTSLALNLLPKVGSNDLAPYLGIISSLPGIESLNLPMVFTLRSGEGLKVEWHIPLKGLESLAQVIRGVMGPPNQ